MMRLLIAEDDEVLRRELSRDLESHGYETAVPERFEDVEDIVKEGKVHLVLLDVTLPGRDGYEICRSIRRFSRIPILFLTSRDTDMDELYGMTMGGDDFVRKPYKMPILLAELKPLSAAATRMRGQRGKSCGRTSAYCPPRENCAGESGRLY